MVCPYCNHETQVSNSRHQKRTNSVWRRRCCTNCGIVFTTHEKADLATSTVVQKRAQVLEPLNRDKLFISIYESCKHRPTALQDARALTETIIARTLTSQSAEGIVTLASLTESVTQTLQNFDSVSATYYRAYYIK